MTQTQESRKEVIGLYNQTIQNLLDKTKQSALKPPYQIKFQDPTGKTLFSTPISMVGTETPSWNEEFPRIAEGQVIVSMEGCLLNQMLDITNLRAVNAWENAITNCVRNARPKLSGPDYTLEVFGEHENLLYQTKVHFDADRQICTWDEHKYPDVNGILTFRLQDKKNGVIESRVDSIELEEPAHKTAHATR